MIFEKLGTWVAGGIIYTSLGIVAIEKMFTEHYQPWSKLMRVDEFQKQVRSGQGVKYYPAPELAGFPHFTASDSKAKIVQYNAVSCEGVSSFVKIRLTSGPKKNKVGWVCDGLYRTVGMP